MVRIAAATVIRGEGACQAYIDGVVNEEVKRLNERHRIETAAVREELSAVRGHRNELLTARLTQIKASTARRRGWWRRLRDRLADAWAMFCAITLETGLWEWDDDDDQ